MIFYMGLLRLSCCCFDLIILCPWTYLSSLEETLSILYSARLNTCCHFVRLFSFGVIVIQPPIYTYTVFSIPSIGFVQQIFFVIKDQMFVVRSRDSFFVRCILIKGRNFLDIDGKSPYSVLGWPWCLSCHEERAAFAVGVVSSGGRFRLHFTIPITIINTPPPVSSRSTLKQSNGDLSPLS